MHMFFLKSHKLDTFFLSLLTLTALLLWWPTRMLPYWWDSAGFIMRAAKFYFDTNFSSFILPSDFVYSVMAHPPLFPYVLAIVWKIFGNSLPVSHLFYLPFVLATVVGTYLLAKKIAQFADHATRHSVGFGAALLLLATPLFVAQIGIIYLEIPTAAFAVWALYFFLQKRMIPYIVSASFMLLMKEVSFIVIGAIALVTCGEFVRDLLVRAEPFKQLMRRYAILLLFICAPILILVGWFAWHWLATGWLFALPYYDDAFHGEIMEISLWKIFAVLQYFFLAQLRWIPTIFLALALFVIASRGMLPRFFGNVNVRGLASAGLIAVLTPVLFGKLEFLPRYVVFALPFFCIFFTYTLGWVLQARGIRDPVGASKGIVFWAALLGLAFAFTLQWDTKKGLDKWNFVPLEENTEYLHVIRTGKQMAQFVEENYPDARVLTSFPANYMLAEPFQGYVSRPIQIGLCDKYKEGDRVDLIVFHLLSPASVQCRDLVQGLNFKPLDAGAFAESGKWMQIYAPALEGEDVLE